MEEFQDRGNPKDQGLARLLIPLALRNSVSGMLSIKQIVSFFTRHFQTCSVENQVFLIPSVPLPVVLYGGCCGSTHMGCATEEPESKSRVKEELMEGDRNAMDIQCPNPQVCSDYN